MPWLADFGDLQSITLLLFTEPHSIWVLTPCLSFSFHDPSRQSSLLPAISTDFPFQVLIGGDRSLSCCYTWSQLSPHLQLWISCGWRCISSKWMLLWDTKGPTTALPAHTCLACSVFHTVVSRPVLSYHTAVTLRPLKSRISILGDRKDTDVSHDLQFPHLWLHTLPSLAVPPNYFCLNFQAPFWDGTLSLCAESHPLLSNSPPIGESLFIL